MGYPETRMVNPKNAPLRLWKDQNHREDTKIPVHLSNEQQSHGRVVHNKVMVINLEKSSSKLNTLYFT